MLVTLCLECVWCDNFFLSNLAKHIIYPLCSCCLLYLVYYGMILHHLVYFVMQCTNAPSWLKVLLILKLVAGKNDIVKPHTNTLKY